MARPNPALMSDEDLWREARFWAVHVPNVVTRRRLRAALSEIERRWRMGCLADAVARAEDADRARPGYRADIDG